MAGANNKILKKYGYSAAQVRSFRANGTVISDIRTFAMSTPPARFTNAFKDMMAAPRIQAMREARAARAGQPKGAVQTPPKPPPKQEPKPPPKREPEPKKQAPHQNVADFSRDINQIAKRAKEGQWLGTKTFIHQVHKDYVRKHGDISEDAFKRRIVDAARAGKILLSRADLMHGNSSDPSRAGAYSRADLTRSQIQLGGDVYHFVEHGWL